MREFDPEQAVVTYREVIARLEAETIPAAQEEWRDIARRLRRRWKEWQGENSLHETAFGEPDA